MARYRKVDPRIWNDRKFRSLSDDGKLIFLMLLTHPQQTSIGAFRVTVAGIAAELHWGFERVSKGFRNCSERGMIRVDEEACLAWLPNWFRYNKPENENVVKGWLAATDLLPECDLKLAIEMELRKHAAPYPTILGNRFETLSKPFGNPFETVSKPFRNQEQEQDPEPNQEKTSHREDGT